MIPKKTVIQTTADSMLYIQPHAHVLDSAVDPPCYDLQLQPMVPQTRSLKQMPLSWKEEEEKEEEKEEVG